MSGTHFWHWQAIASSTGTVNGDEPDSQSSVVGMSRHSVTVGMHLCETVCRCGNVSVGICHALMYMREREAHLGRLAAAHAHVNDGREGAGKARARLHDAATGQLVLGELAAERVLERRLVNRRSSRAQIAHSQSVDRRRRHGDEERDERHDEHAVSAEHSIVTCVRSTGETFPGDVTEEHLFAVDGRTPATR